MPQPVATPDLSRQFLEFIQQQALSLRAGDTSPETLDDWTSARQRLRRQLIRGWGGFPQEACPLEPRIVGTLQRDGYRVEKLLLQTRPGVLMTANAYVPAGDAPRPAVLCVHGHWRGAKQEPVVQSRCIGLAKLGFFVLMVDACGAGERGIGKALGEYHGEMVAATLWPTGLALAGLQVYENMRAVDYLQSRPEVDPDHIGVTGASGGGNQSMYVGAIDERLKCVVPVCSVGTYQAYLGAACCMCEVTPSALSYAEESAVLALVAPRALMVVSATKDAFQFSVGEARKSLDAAGRVFALYDKKDHLRHAVFESRHDYNQAMREAMYGWMTRHLKSAGDGSPIAEPALETEDAETLRCFPGESRPDDFITLPAFAAAEARRLLRARPNSNHLEQWEAEDTLMRESLPRVLGGFPRPTPLAATFTEAGIVRTITLSSEPGVTISARRDKVAEKPRGLALLLDLDQGRQAADSPIAEALRRSMWDVITLDLRATGTAAYGSDKVGRAPDHNTAEWSMWLGRPLLGQWVWDVRRLLDTLAEDAQGLPKALAVIGVGPASLVALCAAALDRRIDRVATLGGLTSYVSEVPYENQRLGIMVPGILRDLGDVPQIAAMCAPRQLVIAGGVAGGGQARSLEQLQTDFARTRTVYKLHESPARLTIHATTDAPALVAALTK